MVGEVIVVVFPSRSVLTKALDHLKTLRDFEFEHAAIVAKANSGEVVVLDDQVGPDEGGIAGGTLGAAMAALGIAQLGALALPGIGPIVAIGAGALIGGLVGNVTGRFAANLIDFGYKHEQIETLAQELKEGHPALVLSVKDFQTALPLLQRELAPYNAELIERLRAVGGTA
ncbi:MAG: hypothetical protein L0219_19760 [Phycisphaerales bacterium]|nr:hypothetical protein [Phycisphaerales bacterium]